MRERETKFIVPRRRSLPAPAELLRGLGDVAVDAVDQDAVYYDTDDLRLTRAGASLRYRSDDGWTVKLPESSGAALEREELSFAGDDEGEPPDAALGCVRAIARSEVIRPVARVATRRRRARLTDRAGRLIGEVDDDLVRGTTTHATHAPEVRFHEVEFEVAPDADAKVVAKVTNRVTKRLRHAGAKSGGNRSKVSRVLGDAAELPSDLPSVPALGRRSTVEDLARACLAAGVRRLVVHDPIVRIGTDSEGVHQARVATRRLRSDLRTLRPVLEPRWSEPLRDELEWLGDLLGRVRDADVLAALLTEHADTLPPGQHARAARFLHQIDDERRASRAALLAAMDSPRYTALLDQLIDGAHAPRLRKGTARKAPTVAHAAPDLLRKPWRRLRKEVQRLPAEPSDRELHEVRKRAKQARYAFEAVTPVLGKSARRVGRRLADLQDVLGDHQDSVVAAAWLEQASLRADDVVTAFIGGELTHSFLQQRSDLRRRWHDQWTRTTRDHRAHPSF